ncbi:MAG: hypothetical protein KGN00_02540 [Chloroflexota bacterium]|nr:hypothetical protein [Chloroflexota bacterium]MDE3192543.1 hypothetical protein [Chloroflexota bacterium]
MGQTNINTPGGATPPPGDGFGAGMIVGIVLLILIVLVLVFYAGPQIFINNSAPRSLLDAAFALA